MLNVRRGNTLVKVGNQFSIARKGLMKFFDLRLAYISKYERLSLSTKSFMQEKHAEKNYILAPVLKSILQG